MENENLPEMSDAAKFMVEVQSHIAFRCSQPIYSEGEKETVVIRLRHLAADMVRLMDSVEYRGGNVRDILHQVNRERDIECLLDMSRNDYEEQFDDALFDTDEDEGWDTTHYVSSLIPRPRDPDDHGTNH
jgi:hypothetical protein